MTRLRGVVVLSLAAALSTGCFDIQQSLTLERNLSGKAGFGMKIDMEPMVFFLATMQREMAGKKGAPTPEELAAARAEFVSSNKKQPTDYEAEKRELASKLPPGVTLLDGSFTEGDLSFGMNLLFGFDDLAKLAAIEFPKAKGGKGPGGEPGNPIESPFGGLKIVDEGATVLITGPPQNPAASGKAQAPPDAEAQKMIGELLKGLNVAFRITAPFEVIQHNAHRKEGNTLVWQYDLKSLEKLKPAELNSSIKVRYRK